MYTLADARRAARTPRLALRELNRLYHTRGRQRQYDHRGVNVFDEDWDNLLLLDGCSHDSFARRHDLPGRLERRRARGSHCREFLRGNVADRRLDNTVYVTATPEFTRCRDDLGGAFHRVVDLWHGDGVDERYRTVLPETVTSSAMRARDRDPDRRLVVQFRQPSPPFVGPTGARELHGEGGVDWESIARDDPPDDLLRDAFRENLDIVLPYVEDLLRSLPGRTVVSADHGELVGERSAPVPVREYGHPAGVWSGGLVEVPWLVHDEGPRRDTVAAPTVSPDPADGSVT
jgi:hypothetical protein